MPEEGTWALSPQMQAFVERRRKLNEDRASALAERTQEILKSVALSFDGELFKGLRESYAEADPAFRARMEAMDRD